MTAARKNPLVGAILLCGLLGQGGCGGDGKGSVEMMQPPDAGSGEDAGGPGPEGKVVQGLKTRVSEEVVRVADTLSLDVSADGKTVLVGTQHDVLLYSNDGGSVWWKVEGLSVAEYWSAVAVSADGKKLAALGQYLYVSSDGGDTWTELEGVQRPEHFALSADGSTMVRSSGDLTNVAVSHDFGQTWQDKDIAQDGRYLEDIDISADGSRIVLTHRYAPFSVSSDGGETWFEAGSSEQSWMAASMSSDGQRLSAASFGAPPTESSPASTVIGTSKDGGKTWVEHPLEDIYDLQEVTSSEDGRRILTASIEPADLFRYSEDGGETWRPFKKPVVDSEWQLFTLSFALDEGRILALERNSGHVWITDDEGETWKLTIQGNGFDG